MSFDWSAMMRLGMGRNGLTPTDFYDLTPAELMISAGLDSSGVPAAGRDWLEDLIAKFPDEAGEGHD